ncbi:unnamed protein product [Paramecium sonneborni]|uniref:Acid phosphatase n=1 Tax=Paramecium sonneborni TaxID=65129 RepID=A0A8S1PF41_9CILI|nr:unnamed protein product [Paramecium sonneborni]
MFLIMFLFLTIRTQDQCEPFGIRLFLGHYYTFLKIDTDALRIVFNTKSKCNNYFSLQVKGDQDFNLTSYKTKFLNMTDVYVDTKANIQYETYIHTFQIPIQQTSKIQYILKQKDSLVKEAIVKLPHLYQNTTKVLFFGDMDSSWKLNRSKPTFDWFEQQIKEETEFDSLLFTGDMAYDLESENCLRGEQWLSRISLFTSQYPFMIAPGNHDGGYDYKQTFLRQNFQMLYLNEYDTSNYQNNFYSFNIGLVHFIQYDPVMIVYKADPNNSTQERLLSQFKNDLIQAVQNRQEVPWIVVFTHYPIYCNYMDDDQCVHNFHYLAEFEKLFQEYHVDLYISGHQHNYQRNMPYYQNHSVSFQIDGNKYYNYESPISIIEGAGGADYGPEIMIYNDQPYTVKQLAENGVGLLQVMNKTHLQFQHIQVSTNQIMDEIWIIKTNESANESANESGISFNIWFTIYILDIMLAIIGCLIMFFYFKNKSNKSKIYKKALDSNLV